MTRAFADVLSGASRFAVVQGDMLDVLPTWPEASVSCAPFSPPYWAVRSYGVPPRQWADGWVGCLGEEPDPLLYVAHIVECLRAVKRVLHPSGTVWLNVADTMMSAPSWGRGGSGLGGRPHEANKGASFLRQDAIGRHARGRTAGIKTKDMCLIPERLAIALQDDGWWVRRRITWAKTAAMPSSVEDAPTPSTEPIFLLTKKATYFYDCEAVKEKSVSGHGSGNGYARDEQVSRGGRGQSAPREPTGERRLRDLWQLGPDPMLEMDHVAPWPREVARRCILLGTSERGCCPTCLAPWRRVVELQGVPKTNGRSLYHRDGFTDGAARVRPSVSGGAGPETPKKTIGWEATCKCAAAAPAPGIVLDPFSGSSRTLEVALRLGLRAVGVELRQDWADQSRARLAGVGGAYMFEAMA